MANYPLREMYELSDFDGGGIPDEIAMLYYGLCASSFVAFLLIFYLKRRVAKNPMAGLIKSALKAGGIFWVVYTLISMFTLFGFALLQIAFSRFLNGIHFEAVFYASFFVAYLPALFLLRDCDE